MKRYGNTVIIKADELTELLTEVQQRTEGKWREEDYKGGKVELSVWPSRAEAFVWLPGQGRQKLGDYPGEKAARNAARSEIDIFWHEQRAIARVNERESRR